MLNYEIQIISSQMNQRSEQALRSKQR